MAPRSTRPANTAPAAIYARLSKDDLTERIASQVGRCREHCEANGIDVAEVFAEDDASASRYAQRARPQYQRMIEAVEHGRIGTIVAWDLDRLWRQPKELEHLIELVESGDCRVVTLAGDLDLAKADDRFRARIMVSVAAKESDDKSRRIRARHEDIAAAGVWSGGKRPYGYTVDRTAPGGLAVAPEEAGQIREWVRRIIAGATMYQLVAEANDGGIPTAQGGEWTVPSLRGIVTADRIAGVRVHRRTGTTTPGKWEAIVTPGELASVRRVLAARGGRRQPDDWRRYLLSGGLAVCAACGAALIAHRGTRDAPRYICPPRRRGGCGGVSVVAERLEATVALMACHAAADTTPTTGASSAATTEAFDIAGTEGRLQELMADYATGNITRAEWETARGILTAKLAEAQRVAAGDPLAEWRRPGALTEAWPDLPHASQRVILEAMFERIEVRRATKRGPVWDPDRVVPTWRL